MGKVDWKLLIFLILLLNVKIGFKLIAIGVICLWQYKHLRSWKLDFASFPPFYILIIAWALVTAIWKHSFATQAYIYVFIYGTAMWILCLISFVCVRRIIRESTSERIVQTLILFFILNAVFSLATLFKIILETSHLNPYLYQGNYQKYFISTGDFIKGISFDTSTTNAALNAFGVIFFLRRNYFTMVLLCMIILLLTGSNTINALLLVALIVMFIRMTSNQRSISVVCLCLLVVFMVKISPQNNNYASFLFDHYLPKPLTSEVRKPDKKEELKSIADSIKEIVATHYLDSLSSAIAKTYKTNNSLFSLPHTAYNRIIIPGDSIHTPAFQHKDDTDIVRSKMIAFISSNKIDTNSFPKNKPGKILAFQETFSFLLSKPSLLIAGAGIGNFSSKLALKATRLEIEGSYFFPQYIFSSFLKNHLTVFSYYFSKKTGVHSIINSPNSVYNQIAGEYGVVGILLLIVFYFGFIFYSEKKITDLLPLIVLALGLMATDYWFEQISIIPFFELLWLLSKKEFEEKAL